MSHLRKSKSPHRFSGVSSYVPGHDRPAPGDEEGGWLTVILVTLLIVAVGFAFLFIEVQH